MTGALAGKLAVVTGASRGFGRAIAERFAREGAAVALIARSRDALGEVAAAIAQAGGTALAVAADVSSPADVERAAREIAALGAPAILVNDAGVPGPLGPMWDTDPDAWWRAHEVHVRGAFLCARAFVPAMIANGGGRVLTIASLAGATIGANVSAYRLSKAAQIRFTELLAVEGKPHGVFAFAVHPGTAITDMARTTLATPDAERWAPGLVALLRAAERTGGDTDLARCAALCVELASGAWDDLTGRFVKVGDDLAGLR